MKVLITGAGGQLGQELVRTAPEGWTLYPVTRKELDITDPLAVRHLLGQWTPTWVINAAAYTQVDEAENNPAMAMAVNRDGVVALARGVQEIGAGLVQVSTDFVFDGRQGRPYLAEEAVSPLGVYGVSKAAGEAAVQEILAEKQWLIVRTAWLYASHGRNFVRTILRLLQEREQVRVVADQIGSPTWAGSLAEGIWLALTKQVTGILHWTDAGVASWYDLAVAVMEEAIVLGWPLESKRVLPITTADYPTPARRPEYSVLDKTATWQALGIEHPTHWRVALRHMLRQSR